MLDLHDETTRALDRRFSDLFETEVRVFPVATFDTAVLELADQLTQLPPNAIAVTKSLINQAAGVDRLDYHLDQELQHLVRIADGSEFAEGLAAFFERRVPAFEASREGT